MLEAEINLREDTRVLQQARPALQQPEFAQRADALYETQDALRMRIDDVEQRIERLPDGAEMFANEIRLMQQVSIVMQDAARILHTPETGPQAIAAETEAIELLLQSRRINPQGGGGSGDTPGGGGSGTTSDSALALLGQGVNAKEVREQRPVSQASGEAGPVLPEEYRSGLDQYFNRLVEPAGG